MIPTGQDDIVLAIQYLTKFSTLAALGSLDKSCVSRQSFQPYPQQTKRSSVIAIKDAIKAALSATSNIRGQNNVERRTSGASALSTGSRKDFFQNVLITTAEKLANQVREIAITLSTPLDTSTIFQETWLKQTCDDLIPIAYSLAWLVPIAASDLHPLGTDTQERVISACEHILSLLGDLLQFIATWHRTWKALKQQSKQSRMPTSIEGELNGIMTKIIRAFNLFLDRLQSVDELLKSADPTVLAVESLVDFDECPFYSTLPQRGRSISSILYPSIDPEEVRQVQLSWKVKQSIETAGGGEPSAPPLLPASLARNLLTKSVVIPPPYNQLAQKIEILQAMSNGQDLLVYDLAAGEREAEQQVETAREVNVDPERLIRSEAKYSYKKQNKLLLLAGTGDRIWKDCVVELYGGDLIVMNRFSSKKPFKSVVLGHLQHLKMTAFHEKTRCYSLKLASNGNELLLQFSHENHKLWLPIFEKILSMN